VVVAAAGAADAEGVAGGMGMARAEVVEDAEDAEPLVPCEPGVGALQRCSKAAVDDRTLWDPVGEDARTRAAGSASTGEVTVLAGVAPADVGSTRMRTEECRWVLEARHRQNLEGGWLLVCCTARPLRLGEATEQMVTLAWVLEKRPVNC
jgi:hypothetical protein